ncbi:MAG: hypothetical protein KJ772_08045 [Proteobacteria bacterium]|nr:hypothetical protein [Pseudomonadota bacterium]
MRIVVGAAGFFFAFTHLHPRLSPKGMAAMKSRLAAGVFELVDKIFGAHVSPAVIIPRFNGICDWSGQAPRKIPLSPLFIVTLKKYLVITYLEANGKTIGKYLIPAFEKP